jgi:5-methylcytosine-specific restriction endonuclease McrA
MNNTKTSWNKGLKGFMKGRKVSVATRVKQSESQRLEKNHNWKGGISIRKNRRIIGVYQQIWRDAVLLRDKSSCQICGRFCMYPFVHHVRHIKDYPELKYSVENGVTLCNDCHLTVHKVTHYRKRSEFSESLKEMTLSQAWQETVVKVQRILAETKELYSMSVMPTRAPRARANIYAEHTGDSMNQGIITS